MTKRESRGERIIRTFLQRRDVTFQQNYRVETFACLPPYQATGRLFVDFVIYRHRDALNVVDPIQRTAYIICAIEYDGHGSHFDNLKQMSRDRLKTHWCHAHNIPLRRIMCEPAEKHAEEIEQLVEHFLTHPYGAYREASSASFEVDCPCTPRDTYREAQRWYDLDVNTSVPRPTIPLEFLQCEVGEEPRALTMAAERNRWAIVPYTPNVTWRDVRRALGWLKDTTWRAWLWTYKHSKKLAKRVHLL